MHDLCFIFIKLCRDGVLCTLWCGVSEEAAETEPAWKGAGQEVGLQIWRIVVSINDYKYLNISGRSCHGNCASTMLASRL